MRGFAGGRGRCRCTDRETVADMAVLGFENEIARPDELHMAPDSRPPQAVARY